MRDSAFVLLKRLGYTVLIAKNGLDALSLAEKRGKKPIHLLFINVTMQQMNGRELSERILAIHREARVLYTSAFGENALAHQGLIDSGSALLSSPYTSFTLACNVRAVLDSGKVLPEKL